MHKKHKKKCYLIKNIIKYINSDKKLKGRRRKYNFLLRYFEVWKYNFHYLQDIFNHPNRKYNLKILLKYVIHILITGLSYRSITDFSNSKIHWNTIYKYISKKNKTIKNKSNILLTDTTLISNKLGIDNIGYNPQHPKHKVSKVSLTVSMILWYYDTIILRYYDTTIYVRISYYIRKWYSVNG